ncbi:MAG: transporter substrate-binding domain-containing protein [Fibromonadales bacterium]|nr:transporter substrate-binding domain-containing protein [Fibromonadales bacterium]
MIYCFKGSKEPPFDIKSIKSYSEIPGVTKEEIAAVEELKSARQSFKLQNDSLAGFTAKFCELLSTLFDTHFAQEIHNWDFSLKGIIAAESIDYEEFFSLAYTPVSLIAANPEFEPIVSVVSKYIAAGGIDILYELYKESNDEFAKYKFRKSLNNEETAYIANLSANNAKVRIALENDYYPVCFYDKKQKKFQGIAPDILAEVTKLAGIEFEVATDKNTLWTEILDMLRTNEVALVSELLYSKEREAHFIWTNVPYFSSHYALLSRADYPNLKISQVARTAVGLVKGAVHEEAFDKWFPQHPNIKRYNTYYEAFDALEKGEIDLFMTSDSKLLFQMNFREKSGYKANIIFSAPIEQSFFGLNKNQETLRSIISKAQNFVNTEQIAKHWASRIYDYSKKQAYERSVYLSVSAVVLLLLLIIISILFAKNIRTKNLYEEATKMAHKASKTKSNFLAKMSHEIRTPVNAIMGITEIELNKERNSTEAKEALGKIYKSSYMLLGIINDILDISKVETDKFELMPEKYETASLINDIVNLNQLRIDNKPIKFELKVSEKLPCYLLGDDLRVKQIINNLLSNAFKYTKKGYVKLEVYYDVPYLVVKVSDTGLGMTKEHIANLFDEYSRFNMAANRTIEGTGLGMSITKKLVEMMHGKIDVKSELGTGTAFVVHLAQKSLGTDTLGKELAKSLQNFNFSDKKQMEKIKIKRDFMPAGRVLIVDDLDTNLFVTQGLLQPYGLKIEIANSGFEALEKIKNNEYNIVFMDHMMPEMDGVETAKRIREFDEPQKRNLPIVALTANAVSGTKEMFLANGFNDFLSKPIDVLKLDAILKKWIPKEEKAPKIEALDIKKNIPMTDGMRHFFVLNPHSFPVPGSIEKVLAEIENCFSQSDAEEHKVYISRYPRDAVAIVHNYIQSVSPKETVRIYAIGGDGILFDCLNGMIGFPNAELTNVPYGRANDFVRAFGENAKQEFLCIDKLLNAPSHFIDIINCGSNYAINQVGIGMEGQATIDACVFFQRYRSKIIKPFVRNIYTFFALRSLLNKEVMEQRYQVLVDGEDLSGNYFNIKVANGPCSGGSMVCSPYSKPNDGLLNVTFGKSAKFLKQLKSIGDFTKGHFEKHDIYFQKTFRKMELKSDLPIRVQLDGEAFYTDEFKFEIVPQSVRFFAPEGLDFADYSHRVYKNVLAQKK